MKKRDNKQNTPPRVVNELYADYFISQRSIVGTSTHTHTFFELEYFLNDGGLVYLNHEPFEVKKHSLCISIPTDYHMLTKTEGEPFSIINLSFMNCVLNKDLQSKLLYSPCTNMYYLDNETAKRVEFLLDLLKSEQEKQAEDQFAELCIQSLLTLVLRERKDGKKTETNTVDTTSLTAIQYVHDHFKESLSLQSVAQVVGLNPAYFSYLFHKQTGFKFKEYLTETRINYAKKLIRNNGEMITFACYESGFNSYSSFSRSFIDIVGISPSEYAEKYKK